MKILQLTDFHLFGSDQGCLLEINTFDTLQAVIKDIKLLPDIVVISGDISQDYSADSYEFAKKIMSEFKCPIFVIPGNHDNPKLFGKILTSAENIHTDKVINYQGWRIILLNTQIPRGVAGFLAPEELRFLETELKANQATPTMIFLHHHILPIKCAWLDRIKLLNGRQFLEKIEQYENIKLVVCGHVHQEFEARRNNTHFLATPSTCIQFASNSEKFKLDGLMPGYRWFELNSDATYTTEVVRIEHNEVFVPDINNQTGY
jgi:3',5'-cyclic-AMP phosphodiesterase